MTDPNEFFKRATKEIASTLDIDKALERTLKILRTVMPADAVVLSIFNNELRTVQFIARAGRHTLDDIPSIISMPAGVQVLVDEMTSRSTPTIEISNNPREMTVVKRFPEMADSHPHFFDREVSSISMNLVIEGEGLVMLNLQAEGFDRYTAEHARWLEMLNEPFAIAAANALAHQRVLRLRSMLEDDNRFLQHEILSLTGDQIIGEEFGLREVMDNVRRVAAGTSPVLLCGETGTGKDLIANSLHFASPRRNGAFIKVNCGAIPDSLIDSELFGHEKGAFTGAVRDRRGRFERAHEGTIFLDEVGELPPQAQVRLLRVLQNKEIERVGGTETIHIDARVVAASNRDLTELVKARLFREDLFFRLNVFPIHVPPLRHRKSDIPALVHHFVEKKALQLKLPRRPTLSPGSMDALLGHDWPGNVRELENLVERAMILFPEGVLRFDRLLAAGRPTTTFATDDAATPSLDEVVADHIRRVLARTGGKIHGPDGAAELLQINPNTLRSKMKKLGLAFPRQAANGRGGRSLV